MLPWGTVKAHQPNPDVLVSDLSVSQQRIRCSCSATKEATTSLNEPMRPTLDEALEYVIDDELVEVISSYSFFMVPCNYHCWHKSFFYSVSVYVDVSAEWQRAAFARQSTH